MGVIRALVLPRKEGSRLCAVKSWISSRYKCATEFVSQPSIYKRDAHMYIIVYVSFGCNTLTRVKEGVMYRLQ